MRYPASEKLEIIRLVEQSHLSARRTLHKLGILWRDIADGMVSDIEGDQFYGHVLSNV